MSNGGVLVTTARSGASNSRHPASSFAAGPKGLTHSKTRAGVASGQPQSTKGANMYANMTLGELIKWLEDQDQSLIVKDGFSSPHSDRGNYAELAFNPVDESSIGDMLAHARSALGARFPGWKGGSYKMNERTSVYIGEFGECGEEITSTHFKYWLLTGRKP